MEAIQALEEVKSLSDAELRGMLVKYGVEVGPIMVTTRSVYERKLMRLLQNIDTAPKEAEGDYADNDDYDDDYEDDSHIEVVEPSFEKPPSPPRRSPVKHHSPVRQRHPVDHNMPTPRAPVVRDPNNRYVPRTPLITPVHKQPPQPQDTPAGLSRWVKALVLFFVLVLVYLIYVNMDTAVNVPESLTAELPDV